MSITLGYKSYFADKSYTTKILNYNSRKSNGDIPNIIIGKFCSIAINCTFVMSNHLMNRITTSPPLKMLFSHKQGNKGSYSKGDIIIKNDVWIGANCTIIDNITINNGAVISAGSVVTKNVPAYAIVGGNPAKIINYRFSEDIIKQLLELNFWDLPNEEIDTLDLWTDDIEKFIKDYKIKYI
jgi:acetyltransferase-like isoleucine patch superfamily enzyme